MVGLDLELNTKQKFERPILSDTLNFFDTTVSIDASAGFVPNKRTKHRHPSLSMPVEVTSCSEDDISDTAQHVVSHHSVISRLHHGDVISTRKYPKQAPVRVAMPLPSLALENAHALGIGMGRADGEVGIT